MNYIGVFRLVLPLTMDIFVFNEVVGKVQGWTTVMLLWIFSFIEMNFWRSYLQYENKESEIGTKLTTENSNYLLQLMCLNLKKYIAWVEG